jgi:ribose transport system substrate-binding protein
MLPRRVALASLLAIATSPVATQLLGCKRGPKTTKLAVIPKGTTHEFWKAVHAGALRAGAEEHVEIIWNGPLKEDDLKEQIDIVQSFAAQGVAGIVLAPLSDQALLTPVKSAKQGGIPTVIFDSDLQGSEHVSFVATDNFAAGKMAGEAMAKLLESGEGAGGDVIVLRYQEGSASTSNREAGFLEALKAHPSIKIASESQHGGATVESAHKTAENLLSANKNVRGVFCPNESTTFGMLLALQQAGLAGKVRFIGFDASEKLVQAVRSGTIDALVLQDPFKIGYLAVKTMARHLRGEKVDARVDTGATLATKASLETPAVKALLSPDLSAVK